MLMEQLSESLLKSALPSFFALFSPLPTKTRITSTLYYSFLREHVETYPAQGINQHVCLKQETPLYILSLQKKNEANNKRMEKK
jgi:hypothetical protein